jgi:hypothetical protein
MKTNFLFFALLFSTAVVAQQDTTKAAKPAPGKSKSMTVLGINAGSNQFAIIGNISDTTTIHTQTSAIFNTAAGPVVGMQLTGIVNVASDSLVGTQISGVVNTAQSVNGIQVAGVGNFVEQNVNGAQIAGTVNMAVGHVEMLQASGSFNYARSFRGAQISGTGNIVTDTSFGVQFGGAFNFANKQSNLIQLGGSVNYASGIRGAQMAGFLNISNGNVYGAQLSGFINYAHTVKGLQLGVLNFADSVNGVSIGLFSFVKHGYHKLELSANENTLFNAAFHTGSNFFHNIISFNVTERSNDIFWSYGYGFGSAIKMSPRFDMCIDLTGSHVSRNRYNERVSEHGRVDLLADFHITKKISVFAGPSLNLFVYDIQGVQGENSMAAFVPYDFYNETFNNRWTVRSWVGFKAGFRFF